MADVIILSEYAERRKNLRNASAIKNYLESCAYLFLWPVLFCVISSFVKNFVLHGGECHCWIFHELEVN